MVTGYEQQMYRSIDEIARESRRQADALEEIAEALAKLVDQGRVEQRLEVEHRG